jgi:lipoic acid synthetase
MAKIELVNRKFPDWLKVRLPKPEKVQQVEQMMREARLHTVCESARCPNLPECWSKGSATFMILGDICTRHCGFCAIKTGKPLALDPQEPQRLADAAKRMGLKHIVVTSVARDDLPDEGAGQFAATIRALHATIPNAIVEVLTPDFKAKSWCIRRVVDAEPEIFNHNIETVARLQAIVRPQARYDRSLQVLEMVKQMNPAIYTKSGIMLGLGETREEVLQTMRDLRSVGVDALTIGSTCARPNATYPCRSISIPTSLRSIAFWGRRGLPVRRIGTVYSQFVQCDSVLAARDGREARESRCGRERVACSGAWGSCC